MYVAVKQDSCDLHVISLLYISAVTVSTENLNIILYVGVELALQLG